MSGDGPKPKKARRRILTEEDVELWSFVARSIGPAKGKSRVRDVEPVTEMKIEVAAKVQPTSSPPRREVAPAPVPAQPRTPVRAPVVQHAAEAKAIPLDRRKARRIARGAEEIEARLDLHGLTQDEAHHALVGFVRRCHAAGMRTVLVITGKGAPAGRHDHHDDVHGRPRGVLRRNVPRWLGGAEIGMLVISYSTAHVRHGGEGAMYVRLRRKG